MNTPTVLVLASGRGERFVASGGAGSKLDAMLDGQTVLQRTLAAVRASGLPYHVEDAGHPGMGDSIAAAVAATPNAPGWLILPGDLPLISPDSLLRVADALSSRPIVVPFHRHTRGHPVGFDARFRESLCLLEGSEGAASIVRGHVPFRLDLDDEGIVVDIDTVADLAAAEARLGLR